MVSEYKKIILKNGLRLILAPDDSKQVLTALAVFGVGSRYENEKEAGISHVLEHMVFKGTKKRPSSLKIAEFIENIGGEHNAFTAKEYTGFYAKTASKYLDEAVDFLADLLVNPLLREEDLAKEKPVIIQEIDMYEDLPMEVAANKFEYTLFGDNALGREIIGYRQSIESLSSADLINFRASNYSGPNCVIVLAGNFGGRSEKEIISLAESKFVLPGGKPPVLPEIELNQKKSVSLVQRKTEQSHLVIGFRGVSSKNTDKYRLKMLALILGGSMSSRMFVEIREKRSLAYAVKSSTATYLGTGLVDTYAGVPHQRVTEAVEAIMEQYQKIRKDITELEVKKAKEIIYGKKLISLEDTSEVAIHYALAELLGEDLISPAELIKIYQGITLDELVGVAGEYLTENNLALSYVGPESLEQKINKYLTIS